MHSNIEDTLIALLNKKLTLYNEMIKMTDENTCNFLDKKDSIEEFLDASDARHEMFEKTKEIDDTIKKEYSTISSDKITLLQSEIKNTTATLLASMQRESPFLPEAKDFLSKEIKKINDGKNVFNVYSSNSSGFGLDFDAKK
jgi:hypothetical protein